MGLKDDLTSAWTRCTEGDPAGVLSSWGECGPFVSDSFTDVNGTLLDAHVGEIGAAWTKHPSYAAGGVVTVTGGRVFAALPAPTAYYASGVPSNPDYTVSVIMRWLGAVDQDGGCFGRASAGANTMYLAHYTSRVVDGGPRWELLRISGGAAIFLGTFAEGLAIDTDYRVELRMVGTAISLIVNGVTKIAAVNADIATAGLAGVRFYPLSGAQSSVYGLHIANIEAGGVA